MEPANFIAIYYTTVCKGITSPEKLTIQGLPTLQKIEEHCYPLCKGGVRPCKVRYLD